MSQQVASQVVSIPDDAPAGFASHPSVQPAAQPSRGPRDIVAWLLVALIAAGIVLRLVEFLSCHSLWRDEAALAINILDRSFGQLLQPLTDKQAAPPLFLWGEKAAFVLFGNSEYALRLLPLVCGILSVPLFCRLAGRYLNRWQTVLATGIFALSDSLVRYSCEVKQYSSDVLCVLLIYWFTLEFLEQKRLRRGVVLSLCGVLALWMSYPSVFVLTGIGAALLCVQLQQRQFSKIMLLPICSWAAAFLLLLAVQLMGMEVNRSLLELYWSSAFFLAPGWFRHGLLQLGLAIGSGWWEVGVFCIWGMISWGAVSLARLRPRDVILLVLPAIVMLVVSGLHLYPMAARLLLFLVPAAVILLASAFNPSRGPAHLVMTTCLLVVLVIAMAGPHLEKKWYRSREEFRPAFEDLMRNWRKGDTLFVYYGAKCAFHYYRTINDWSENAVVIGGNHRKNRSLYAQELRRFAGKSRLWIIMSHEYWERENDQLESEYISAALNRLGTLKDARTYKGAHLWLYDMSGRNDP